EGSISWQFSEIGTITLLPQKEKPETQFGKDAEYEKVDIDDLQMTIMDLEGVEDIEIEKGEISVYVAKEKFHNVRDFLVSNKYKVEDAELIKMANDTIDLSDEDQS